MLELLQKLFIGHSHIWEEEKTIAHYWDEHDNIPVYYIYKCKCKICGKIKMFKS